MKAATLIIFAMVLVAVSCRPEKLDLKQLKEEGARKKACLRDCTSVKVEPVCASKPGAKPRLFGNECVLNNHNCENKDTLAKTTMGECPKPDGIRLS